MNALWRVGLLGLAVVACAWFALGIRQARSTGEASALVSGPVSLGAEQAQRARSLLNGAATLNPDLEVQVLRGRLAFDRHRTGDAERILESVTRREPLNLQAWLALLYAAERGGDRQTVVRAARNISALFPKLS